MFTCKLIGDTYLVGPREPKPSMASVRGLPAIRLGAVYFGSFHLHYGQARSHMDRAPADKAHARKQTP